MPETFETSALSRELDLSDFQITRAAGKPTQLSFSASSEYPVERYFGNEVLEHSTKAIRMDRVNRGAVPLLFNHNRDDVIGMVDGMRIENSRLMCDAHLFDTERAKEVAQMLDGGLRNVSISYRIHTVQVEKNGDERLIDWEPLEQSIVTIPADPTVGMGRAQEGEQVFEVTRVLPEIPAHAAEPSTKTGNIVMPEERDVAERNDESVAAGAQSAVEEQQPQVAEREAPQPEPVVVRQNSDAAGMERKRRQGIENLCKINKIEDNIRDYWINAGLSLDQVSEDLLNIIEERGKTNPDSVAKIGLTNKETQQFSMLRAIQACVTNDWKLAPFELECSRAIASKMQVAPDPNKFFVPFEVLQDKRSVSGQRDATVAGSGGFLVETQNLGFIEMLRNRSVAFRMGVRRLSGLVGNVTIPRQSAAATAYWLANESTQITESDQTFVQVSLSPKTAGAYTEISRQLLLQSSPSAEGIVMSDLAAVTALAADLAVLNGSGASGQPEGILQTTGIGSVTGTSIDYAKVLEFQTDVAAANVMPETGGYVTTPAVASLLMQRVKFSSTASPLWEGNIWDGNMSGFTAMTSNQMPAATMLFGDWREAIVGEWGVLEVETNPFADFKAGIIGVRAMYSMDVAVRRPFAFSSASSIT